MSAARVRWALAAAVVAVATFLGARAALVRAAARPSRCAEALRWAPPAGRAAGPSAVARARPGP